MIRTDDPWVALQAAFDVKQVSTFHLEGAAVATAATPERFILWCEAMQIAIRGPDNLALRTARHFADRLGATLPMPPVLLRLYDAADKQLQTLAVAWHCPFEPLPSRPDHDTALAALARCVSWTLALAAGIASGRPEQTEPKDGDEAPNGRVYLAGGWHRFGQAQRAILVWVLANPGGDRHQAEHNTSMHGSHFTKTLGDLRKSLEQRLKHSTRALSIKLHGGRLTPVWEERPKKA